MPIIINIFTGIVVLISIVLVVLVMLQTPRNEGIGGVTSVGGNFRGKAGMDEILSNYTRTVAFGWFASAFILAVLNEVSKR
ncbi:MAG: preprotein translocase subunit SecG [Armatimonadetes bacterium]|nr:preprotein translocase subunit SecG [Armatimonadota bacterium]